MLDAFWQLPQCQMKLPFNHGSECTHELPHISLPYLVAFGKGKNDQLLQATF